jgi:hypothetical protein
MKTNSFRKGGQREKRATKRARKSQPQVICVPQPGAVKFSCGIDDQEALIVEESLDERERRG